MANKEPKYQFRRKIDLIKDIVSETHGNDPKKIASLINGLGKIKSIKNLFSKEGNYNYVDIGDNKTLYSANLKKLEEDPSAIEKGMHYAYLFPSDLIRALTKIVNIYSKKGVSGLSEFSKGEFVKVKSWGNFDVINRAQGVNEVDEIAFSKHFEEMQRLLDTVVSIYRAIENQSVLDETKTVTDADLKKIKDALKKRAKAGGGEDGDGNEEADLDDENQKETSQKNTQTEEKQKSAVIPPIAPPTPGTTPPTSQPKGALKPLTPREEQQLVVREIAKLHSQALGRMFGAYGIDSSQVDSSISASLRSEISNHFYSLSPQDQAKFITLSSLGRSITVGKGALREEFLTKVYENFNKTLENNPNNATSLSLTALYEDIHNDPQKYKGLNGSNLAEFKQFHSSFISNEANSVLLPNIEVKEVTEQTSPEDQLENSLKKALTNGKEGIDSKNIETILETLILQNEDKDGPSIDLSGVETKISSMNKEQLASFFGITSIKTMDYLELRNFKGAIATYTARKTVELAISTNNTRLLGNPRTVTGEKGSKPITKHLGFVSVRDSTKEHGAETTANALNYNRKDRKKEVEKIAKQYQSFFGLWENLSAKEQRQVYNKFNIAYDKNMPGDNKLMFVPEFLFFDVGSLKSFKNSITTEQKATYDEFLEANQTYLRQIGDQLVAEEQYGQFLRDSYLFYTQEHQTLLIADYLASQNEGIELTGYPDEAYFDQFSLNQITNADQDIQDNGYTLSEDGQRFSRQNNFIRKLGNSEWGKKLGKRFGLGGTNSPSSKMNKALKSKLNKGLTSVINKLPPGWGTTALKIIRKIGLKRTAMIIAGMLGALFGFLLSKIPGWLKSMLGIGGSEAGGITAANITTNATATQASSTVANSLSSSTLTDATTAEALANSSANAAAQAAATKLATGATIAQASGVFFGLPIAFLAPGISMFIGLIVTIYVIFTIQSAFLVPTPPGLDGYSNGVPIFGDTACFQLMPGGEVIDAGAAVLTSLNWDKKSVNLLKEGLAEVASNSTFIKLLCDGGPIPLYKLPKHPAGYFGWYKSSENKMILYEGAFLSVQQMEYLIIHESSHVIDTRNSGIMNNFAQTLTTSDCFTYPVPSDYSDAEAFAEGIVLYVTSDRFVGNKKPPYPPGIPAGSWPFKENYSGEYNWIKKEIFGGEEFQ